jgi:hypothetical protein
MSIDAYNVIKARVTAAEIRSFDNTRSSNITDIVTAFSISQSIDNTSWRASIRVLDTVGLMSEFPLRGEERILIRIDPGNGIGERTIEGQVYRIDNVNVTETNDGVSYVIHFVSLTTFLASRRKIIRSFPSDSANNVAKKIFDEFFERTGNLAIIPSAPELAVRRYPIRGNRSFFVQPTVGLHDWIIPRYTPFEAMYFLASRSYSENSASCSYRFFETLDGYYFVTDEFLIERSVNAGENDDKRVIPLKYDPFVSKDPRNSIDQIITLETFQNQKRVDSGEDLFSGGYYNIVTEIDLLRRSIVLEEFQYTRDANFVDMTGQRTDGTSTIHTLEYMESTFTRENAKEFILFRDYTRAGDLPSEINGEQYIARIVKNRVAYNHHLNNTAVSATIKGRFDIVAGDIVSLEIPEFTNREGDKERNKQLSGNYLVHTVVQEMEHEVLNTIMKLVKYDWSL